MAELTLEEIGFFSQKPEAMSLYEAVKDIILSHPDVSVSVQKTQITFKAKYGFAFISLKKLKGCPEVFILLTLGLGHRLDSPRVAVATEPYPNRWTHHMIISEPSQLDGEIKGWIDEAYDFALRK